MRKNTKSILASAASFMLSISYLILSALLTVSLYRGGEAQIEKDEAYIEEVIRPAIEFVECFYEEHGIFPTESDIAKSGLKSAGSIVIYTEENPFDENTLKEIAGTSISFPSSAHIAEHYALAFWRGEWWEVYDSRHAILHTNGWNHSDTLSQTAFVALLCLIPPAAYATVRLRKLKRKQ